jgi:hypothetical protein
VVGGGENRRFEVTDDPNSKNKVPELDGLPKGQLRAQIAGSCSINSMPSLGKGDSGTHRSTRCHGCHALRGGWIELEYRRLLDSSEEVTNLVNSMLNKRTG